MDKETARKIRRLIGQDKTNAAIEMILPHVEAEHPAVADELYLQQGKLNNTLKEYRMQVISREDYDLARSRINVAVTGILADLEQGEISEKPPRQERLQNDKQTILVFGANPGGSAPLKIDEEIRQLKDALSMTAHGRRFNLIYEPAVRTATITQAIDQNRPSIVHFSGHGTGAEGIMVVGVTGGSEMFSNVGLDRLFALFRQDVRIVFMNACYSEEQARVISAHNIHVVGMNKAITDDAAIRFAVGFYQGIGNGGDVVKAYRMGMVTISTSSKDTHTPELWYGGERILPENDWEVL